MRRANGAGCVTKLSGNRRKPWMARVTVGWKDGRQLYKTIGYFETKAKAEEAIALDRVMPVAEHASITLRDLFEQWKKTRAYTDVSKHTKHNHNASFNYMTKYYNKPFRDLRLPQFQDMIDTADALGRGRSCMDKIKTLAGLLSKYAKDQDIIMKTYYENMRLPKEKKNKKTLTFTEIEIQKLFDNGKIPLVDTILILIYTGMRPSAMLQLTKFNIDIKNMIITGGIKTDAGTDRIIPIHPRIQKYIKARYESAENYLIEYDKKLGSQRNKNIRFVRSPYKYERYLDLFCETMEKLEINPPGIHRLTPGKARHTFFTRLSKCKDRKGKAIVGGHTDPNFTEKRYDQPDIERLRKVITSMK